MSSAAASYFITELPQGCDDYVGRGQRACRAKGASLAMLSIEALERIPVVNLACCTQKSYTCCRNSITVNGVPVCRGEGKIVTDGCKIYVNGSCHNRDWDRVCVDDELVYVNIPEQNCHHGAPLPVAAIAAGWNGDTYRGQGVAYYVNNKHVLAVEPTVQNICYAVCQTGCPVPPKPCEVQCETKHVVVEEGECKQIPAPCGNLTISVLCKKEECDTESSSSCCTERCDEVTESLSREQVRQIIKILCGKGDMTCGEFCFTIYGKRHGCDMKYCISFKKEDRCWKPRDSYSRCDTESTCSSSDCSKDVVYEVMALLGISKEDLDCNSVEVVFCKNECGEIDMRCYNISK